MFAVRFATLSFLLCAALGAQTPTDKTKLSDYIRYAEGYMPNVQITLDDPKPSVIPGYQQLIAHLTLGKQRVDRVYYLTPDGKNVINGAVWPLGASPFAETLAELPKTGPAFGPANARVNIVVFSDFECPFCQRLAKTIREEIPKQFPNDVEVMFADFPLESIHPWARAMAEAAHCIGDSDAAAFWLFHDWVFGHQQEINTTNLKDKVMGYVAEHGLDAPRIQSCIANHTTAAEVEANIKRGKMLQVDQTPVLYVNGRMLGGAVPWDTINAVIKLELAHLEQK